MNILYLGNLFIGADLYISNLCRNRIWDFSLNVRKPGVEKYIYMLHVLSEQSVYLIKVERVFRFTYKSRIVQEVIYSKDYKYIT